MKYSFGMFCNTDELFAPDAFDQNIGKEIEVNGVVGPPVKGVINKVSVNHEGTHVMFYMEIPDDSELAQFLSKLPSAKLIKGE